MNDAVSKQNCELSEGKMWSSITSTSVQSKTRQIYVANFRKLTGHDLLYKHLSRMGIISSPLCIFCHNEEQTSEHIFNCSGLTTVINDIKESYLNEEEQFSKLYWYVRERQ